MLEGLGVRASGLRGKLCTDLRLWGDFRDEVFLFLATWSELGRPMPEPPDRLAAAAGELGAEDEGEEELEEVAWEESGDHGTAMGGLRMVRWIPGLPSPATTINSAKTTLNVGFVSIHTLHSPLQIKKWSIL